MKNTQLSEKDTQSIDKQKEKPKQTHLSKEQREQQIQQILYLVNEKEMTLKAIAEEMNLKSGGNVSKKLERAGYKKLKSGKYELVLDKDSNVKDKNKIDKNKNGDNEIDDIIKTLNEINKRLSKLETERQKGVMVSNETMNYKAFSVRADESIMNSFNELAATFSNVSKSYLMSIAIKEFVDKYQGENKND